MKPPTLAELRNGPPTLDVATAAAALGCSRSGAYEHIRLGTFPVRTITAGGRIRVLTASLLRILEDDRASGAA
jgi:predicted DNA-binding transcriptional regulator AlpA